MAEEFQLWVLSLEAAGLTARVLVNDVTVYDDRKGEQASFGEKINPLLTAGQNGVNVSLGMAPPVRPGASPVKSSGPQRPDAPPPEPPPSPKFALRIQKGPHGKDPGPEGTLVRFEWQAGGPFTFEGAFQVESLPWEPPPWTRGSPVQPDPPALEAFVRAYADTLRSRNAAGAAALNALKFQHISRSLNLDAADIDEGYRDHLESQMSAPDWAVALAPRLVYSAEGNSHLVRIAGANGEAPVNAVSEGRSLPFEVTVSFIGGNWRIVR